MKPLIYFSYGMTKCGSTLAFHLANVALELGGYPQPKLVCGAIEAKKKINFVQHITAEQADELRKIVDERGYPVVVKTHSRPDPEVVKMVQNGEAIAHAAYRDPRDMALSMMDHGAKARAKGDLAFAEIHTLDDALNGIRNQCDSLTAWLRLPSTMPLFFEDISYDTVTVAQRILDQLEISGDAEQIAHVALNNRFIQKNKAIKHRYLTEMDRDTAKDIAAEFAPLLKQFVKYRANLPTDGSIQLPPPHHLRTSTSET
ncbi:MAG: hypothetical protein JKY31_13620 [Rhodobacteraceae bacterium]|nr:hypothetical protein [Paracoccaceae bacterium]